MAKQVLLEIKVDSSKSVKDLNRVEKELIEIKKARTELNKKVKESTTVNKAEVAELAKLNTRSKELTRQKGQLQKAVINENNAHNKLISAYDRETQELNELRKTLKNALLTEKKMSKETVALAKKVQFLDKRLKRVDAAAGQFQRNVGNYQGGFKGLAGSIGKSAMAATGFVGGALALVGVVKNATNIIKGFEQANANLGAVLGDKGTTEVMNNLRESAKGLGATTAFSASQVTELQTEFAKLGFLPEQIMDVQEATLNLAAASGTDLANAATIAGSTLRAFGLDTTQTAEVVDVMAKGFTTTSLDIEKFKTAMGAVAPVAKSAGFTIQQTTALLGTLTDSGIDASTAGTGLRGIMLDLSRHGLTLDEALAKINNSADKNATAFQLFGKRGAAVATVLATNTEHTQELTDGLNDAAGSAQAMADKQLDTLDGALKILSSSWEGLILSMEDGEGGMASLATGVIRDLATGLGVLSSGITEATEEFSFFSILFNNIKLQFLILKTQFEVVAEIFSRVFQSLGRIAEKLGIVSGEAGGMSEAFLGVQTIILRLPKVIEVFADIAINQVNNIFNAIDGLVDIFFGFRKVIMDVVKTNITAFQQLGRVIGSIFTFNPSEIKRTVSNAFDTLKNSFNNIVEDSAEIIEGGKKIGAAIEAGMKESDPFKVFNDLKTAVLTEDVKSDAKEVGEIVGEEVSKGIAEGVGKNIDKDLKEKLEKKLNEVGEKLEVTLDMTPNFKEDVLNTDVQNLLATAQDQINKSEEKLEKERIAREKARKDFLINTAQETADAVFKITQENSERRKQFEIDQLEISQQSEIDNLKAKHEAGVISAAEFENNRLALEQETQDKRRDIELEAFNRKKRLDTAQALINGALAVTKILAQTGVAAPFAIPAIAASTAIQVATIQAQKFAKGGLLVGDSHEAGGIPFSVGGRQGFEAEGGEAIINKKSTAMFAPLLSALNVMGGGVPFAAGGVVPKFQDGGIAGGVGSGADLDEFSRKIVDGINDKKVINVATETASVNSNVVNIESDVSI